MPAPSWRSSFLSPTFGEQREKLARAEQSESNIELLQAMGRYERFLADREFAMEAKKTILAGALESSYDKRQRLVRYPVVAPAREVGAGLRGLAKLARDQSR